MARIMVIPFLVFYQGHALATTPDPTMNCQVLQVVGEVKPRSNSSQAGLAAIGVECEGYEKYGYVSPGTMPPELTYGTPKKTVIIENPGYQIGAFLMPEFYLDGQSADTLRRTELEKAGLDPSEAKLQALRLFQKENLFAWADRRELIKNPYGPNLKTLRARQSAEYRAASDQARESAAKKLGCTVDESKDMPFVYALSDLTGDIRIRSTRDKTIVVSPLPETSGQYYFDGLFSDCLLRVWKVQREQISEQGLVIHLQDGL